MGKDYWGFIEEKKNRILPEGTYTEKHHILPRCIGGEDAEDNLIVLTASEHYEAHRLLVELYPDNPALNKALFMMMCMKDTLGRDYKVSAEDYSTIREEFARQRSIEYTGEGNPMYGSEGGFKNHHHTLESRNKISNGLKGSEPRNKGKHCYTDGEKNIFKSDGEDIPEGFYPGRADDGRKGKKIKPHSEDHKRKLREANKGKYNYTNGVENVRCYPQDAPEGWRRGMTRKKKS